MLLEGRSRNINSRRRKGYCDIYKWTRRRWPEVKLLDPTSSKYEICTLSDNDVNYHKFSHGAASNTLNGKKVNVMLKLRNNFSLPVNYR